jgi:cyclopropane fatty-acyl-phospholipid synthase-like methyltransferase
MSKRIEAIVRRMKVRPGDRILEIGCGFGVSSTLICEQLTGGLYVAVDRSETSIKAATKRNARFVESGKAQFNVGEFESFDPGRRRFDKIVAIRVRAFHVDAERSCALVNKWLAPKGQLFIEYDSPKSK